MILLCLVGIHMLGRDTLDSLHVRCRFRSLLWTMHKCPLKKKSCINAMQLDAYVITFLQNHIYTYAGVTYIYIPAPSLSNWYIMITFVQVTLNTYSDEKYCFTRTSQGGKRVAALSSAIRVRFALRGTIYIDWVLGKEVKTPFSLAKKNIGMLF